MDDIIQFAQYTYTPKVWQSLTYEDFIKKLPSSKQILTTLNDYCKLYPDFQLKLRTNLWRVHPDPDNCLSSLLPIDIWNEIDSYFNDYRFTLLIRECKLYYIIESQSQIDDKIKEHMIFMRENTPTRSTYRGSEETWLCYRYAKHTMEHYKQMQRSINDYKDNYLSS